MFIFIFGYAIALAIVSLVKSKRQNNVVSDSKYLSIILCIILIMPIYFICLNSWGRLGFRKWHMLSVIDLENMRFILVCLAIVSILSIVFEFITYKKHKNKNRKIIILVINIIFLLFLLLQIIRWYPFHRLPDWVYNISYMLSRQIRLPSMSSTLIPLIIWIISLILLYLWLNKQNKKIMEAK
jgi:phosphoglycerol transferase MdoB-like AlkP superfamily enzyme